MNVRVILETTYNALGEKVALKLKSFFFFTVLLLDNLTHSLSNFIPTTWHNDIL